jgi:hypothetical protein
MLAATRVSLERLTYCRAGVLQGVSMVPGAHPERRGHRDLAIQAHGEVVSDQPGVR